MGDLVSDICGLGLIMSDFLIVRSCKCAKCYCFDNLTNKEAEASQAYTACVRTVTAQRDGGKSVCLLQSWLHSIIWHTAWLHQLSSYALVMWLTKESLGNLSIHGVTYCAPYQLSLQWAQTWVTKGLRSLQTNAHVCLHLLPSMLWTIWKWPTCHPCKI